MTNAAEFAARLKAGETVIGYWVVTDNPVGTERLARVGYDYVALDLQHGMLGYQGMLHGLLAIDAGQQAVGLVRVEANLATPIGKALDAGAAGIIVPLVNSAEDAAAAVAATRYPPDGIRSYGPMRSGLRIGPDPGRGQRQRGGPRHDRDAAGAGQRRADRRHARPRRPLHRPLRPHAGRRRQDLDRPGGGRRSSTPPWSGSGRPATTTASCPASTPRPAPSPRQRIAAGFRLVSVSSDLTHLEAVAQSHLSAARDAR